MAMQETGLVPYSFGVTEYHQQPQAAPGQVHGVYFTIAADQLEWILEKIGQWFEDRDEVVLIANGETLKGGIGFVILEWDECAIDPLFLAILANEDLVDDFSVYSYNQEV